MLFLHNYWRQTGGLVYFPNFAHFSSTPISIVLYLCVIAKAAKKLSPRKKRGEYEELLKVNGSFKNIMKAAVKHRDKNTPADKKAE
jgi:hypothetical protein